jgi:eukaryotic-like serine/threonine-protein kinase
MIHFYKFLKYNPLKSVSPLFVLFLILMLSVISGCFMEDILPDEDWPMFKYNSERTGASRDYNFDEIEPVWKYEYEIFEEGGGSRVSPAISMNQVVIPTRFYISCLNTDNSELIWRKYIGENNSSPIIYRNKVIISATNSIYSFDLKDGSCNWSKDLKKEGYITAGISVPVADDGRIYYGLRGKDDTEGWLYCIDAKDGLTIWKFQAFGPVRTSPVIANGMIIFGADNGTLYCLEKDSGNKVWTFRTGNKIRSSPAILGDNVYFGSNDSYMYCVDLDSGKQKWEYKTGDVINTTPGISDGKIYFSSNDTNVYCLNADNGAFMWKYNKDDLIFTSPTICGKKLLIGLDNKIYCLNSDNGRFIREYKLDDFGISSPMSVHDNRLYLRTISFIYCFELK